MFGGLVKSVTGISKKVTGVTKNFRKVLDMNPGALNLVLPPQVSMGIKIANQMGLKIPSVEELEGKVLTSLDKAVFGAYRPNTDDIIGALKGQASSTPGLNKYLDQLRKSGNGILDQVDAAAGQAEKSVEDVLNSINWLL